MKKPIIRSLLKMLVVFAGSGVLIFFSWRNFEQVKKIEREVEFERSLIELTNTRADQKAEHFRYESSYRASQVTKGELSPEVAAEFAQNRWMSIEF